jgi:hypothetical protein
MLGESKKRDEEIAKFQLARYMAIAIDGMAHTVGKMNSTIYGWIQSEQHVDFYKMKIDVNSSHNHRRFIFENIGNLQLDTIENFCSACSFTMRIIQAARNVLFPLIQNVLEGRPGLQKCNNLDDQPDRYQNNSLRIVKF